jgi:hypothetical protein
MAYLTVTNQPNRVSTVHKSTCSSLGDHPQSTASSERANFEDGLAALAHARNEMPKNFGFCRHCLREFSDLFCEQNNH